MSWNQNSTFTRVFALALGTFCLALEVFAQVGGTQFRMPETYPPPHQNRLKTLTTGEQALPRSDGTLLIKTFKTQTFRDTGDTNAEIIVEAPTCVFNRDKRTASSPGPLQINSGDGKLHIEGEGFLLRQNGTNFTLTISNKVHTIIKKDFLAQSTAGETGTNATPSGPGIKTPSGTNQVIHIYSDHFVFDRESDLITYTKNVRAEDSQMDLTCEVMTIHRSTNAIDKIVADHNVLIVTKMTGGRTTGDHAVYTAETEKQVVELTGDPHWQDGTREGTGKVFIFDRLHNTLRAEGDAYLKLPRNSMSQSGILLAAQADSATNAPASGAGFIELYADAMTFQLPPTNGPVQSVSAEKHVVMVDVEKNSRATGDRALYTEATGLLELTGNAMWQADQRMAKGGILIFDRNNKAFSARTNAFLKLPAVALGRSLPSARQTSRGTATNQFIEILADRYAYQGELLTFNDQVHVALVEAEAIRGMLDCGTLTVTFRNTNQLQSILAETDVYARLLPVQNPAGRTLEKELKCELLKVQMRTNDVIESLVAERNVMATQTETRTNIPKPIRLTLNSETLTALFEPTTNQVANITAERNVVITRDDLTGRGAKALYTASNNIAQLTGNPAAEGPEGKMTADGALLLDRNTGKLKGRKNVKITPNMQSSRFNKTNGPALKATTKAALP
jgi:lipopolysaccharide transport protein LptA